MDTKDWLVVVNLVIPTNRCQGSSWICRVCCISDRLMLLTVLTNPVTGHQYHWKGLRTGSPNLYHRCCHIYKLFKVVQYMIILKNHDPIINIPRKIRKRKRRILLAFLNSTHFTTHYFIFYVFAKLILSKDKIVRKNKKCIPNKCC